MSYFRRSLTASLWLLACCNSNNHSPQTDTTAAAVSEAMRDIYPRYVINWYDGRFDSIQASKALPAALVFAKEHCNEPRFTHEFTTYLSDSQGMTTTLRFGPLFSKDRKHLMIHRAPPAQHLIDIMLLDKDSFSIIYNHEYSGMEFSDDALKDVNGDGYKDFLTRAFSRVGCCKWNVYHVYLYQPQTAGLTAEYWFIHPVFYPRDKIIVGIGYDYAGEAGVYKYKWNGLQVDTLESVFRDSKHKGQFIISSFINGSRSSKIVKRVPAAYRKLMEDIDFFTAFPEDD